MIIIVTSLFLFSLLTIQHCSILIKQCCSILYTLQISHKFRTMKIYENLWENLSNHPPAAKVQSKITESDIIGSISNTSCPSSDVVIPKSSYIHLV